MSKKCISCGAELDDVALYCDECGTCQEESQKLFGNQTSPVSGNIQPDANPVAKKMKSSGFGIASLVLGILAICTFGVFLIPEILGLVFGIIDITYKDRRHGFDVVGITTSIIALLLFLIIMFFV